MPKGRLETFSDGVIAIIITIMVLELRAPHGEAWTDLTALVPVVIAYLLSFFTIAVFWINHHHLFHTIDRVSTPALWANIHFLLWLSFFPFVTSWVSDSHFAPVPVALYGIVLLAAGIAVWLVAVAVLAGTEKPPASEAGERDLTSIVSNVLLVVGIVIAFFVPWLAMVFYFVEAGLWLAPERRLPRLFGRKA